MDRQHSRQQGDGARTSCVRGGNRPIGGGSARVLMSDRGALRRSCDLRLCHRASAIARGSGTVEAASPSSSPYPIRNLSSQTELGDRDALTSSDERLIVSPRQRMVEVFQWPKSFA